MCVQCSVLAAYSCKFTAVYTSSLASPSDSLQELLPLIRIRDQPYVSRTHRVANLNLLAKVSVSDWIILWRRVS